MLNFIVPSKCFLHSKKAKSGVKYYDGRATDGTTSLRIVGFDEDTQVKLSSFSESKTPVKLNKCQIKRGRFDNYELFISRGTCISASPKTIQSPIWHVKGENSQIISIDDMATIPDGTMVSLQATTISIEPVRLVSTGVIQISQIMDSSGSINITMWDNNTNLPELSVTYTFTNVVVSSFCDQKQLSFTNASKVTRIENDIVFTAANKVNDTTLTINDATIIGTKRFNLCHLCINCTKNITSVTQPLSICTHCEIVQVTDNCRIEVSIDLLVKSGNNDPIILHAFTSVVQQMLLDLCGQKQYEDTQEIMLTASKTLTINYKLKDYIVASIQVNSIVS